VHGNPFGAAVGLGFWTSADLNISNEIVWTSNNRDGVAKVAFQANGFLITAQMLAIVAAETTR
jgi:hypothetical protein